MTFAEMKQKDSERYNRLEWKAREKGYIKADQTLESIDDTSYYPWLAAWAAMELDGKVGSRAVVGSARYRFMYAAPPGEMQAAEAIAGYANRRRQFGIQGEATQADNQQRESQSTGGEKMLTTLGQAMFEKIQRDEIANAIAEFANKKRKAKNNKVEKDKPNTVADQLADLINRRR